MNTSAIQNLYLIIGEELRDISDVSSPYIWHPNNQGQIRLSLVCVDNLNKTGMASITVQISIGNEISAFSILLAIGGLLGTVAIGYRAINRPQGTSKKKEIPVVETVSVPLTYVIRSKLKSIVRSKK